MGFFSWLGNLGSTAAGAAGLSLAQGGLNLGGSLLSSYLSNRHDLKMWRMQNDYNSPQAQMARLKAAGLNPNLIYSQGSSIAGSNVGQRPTTRPVDFSSSIPDIVSKLAESQTIVLKMAQEKLAEQNAQLMAENAKLSQQKAITEGFRQENLFASSRKLDVDRGMIQQLSPYNTAIRRLQADDIYPSLASRYKLGNSEMLWRLNSLNPLLIENLGSRNDLLDRIIQGQDLDLRVKSQLAPYNTTAKDNWFIRALINAFNEHNLGKQ